MKAFVINLDRNPERLAFMQEQFKRLGMDVERFRAIDGRGLSSEELRRSYRNMARIVRRHPSCWILNYNYFSTMPTPNDLADL